MSRLRAIFLLFNSGLGPGLALAALLSITAYAFFGPTGILAWSEYKTRLATQQVELHKLTVERDALRNRVHLLSTQQDDGDLKGELIRRELGVAAPDEIVVPLR